jgi:hypothetical protein
MSLEELVIRGGRTTPVDELIRAQGSVIDAVATGATLVGTVEELTDALFVSEAALLLALRDLHRVGWIAVRELPAGKLQVSWA